MTMRWGFRLGIAAGLVLGLWGARPVSASGVPLQALPAAECAQFAAKTQAAVDFAMKAGEDDFTDLTDGSEGPSCHISGSASDQTFAAPGDLIAKIATAFSGWRDDPARAADGPGGAEKGYINGDRIATIEVSWEPGPGVTCSDKEPLSACKILPQQKLWTALIDIVVKPAK